MLYYYALEALEPKDYYTNMYAVFGLIAYQPQGLDEVIKKAIATTFGKEPIPVRGGGSIPICSLFEQELGLKIVFMGFGLDSDNLHSPNEKYDIVNFYKGIETIPYFHQFFAEKQD